MKDLVPHRLHRLAMQVEKVLFATREHGYLALMGQMDAPGDGQFHHPNASFGG